MAERERRPPGRPSIYDKSFHPESYVALSREGKTKAQIAAAWGIDPDTILEWSKDKNRPEFSGAVKRGNALRTAWWTNFGTAQAAGQVKGNVIMTIFLMKNICPRDFRDRIEVADGLDVEEMEW